MNEKDGDGDREEGADVIGWIVWLAAMLAFLMGVAVHG